MQERLRSKYLRAVSRLGNYWLDQFALKINDRSQSKIRNPKSAINNAIDCFEKGLEIDDVAEEFYQNLILCNHKLGRKAEAAKVYERCRNTLMSSLGVEPSEETELLYKRVKGS